MQNYSFFLLRKMSSIIVHRVHSSPIYIVHKRRYSKSKRYRRLWLNDDLYSKPKWIFIIYVFHSSDHFDHLHSSFFLLSPFILSSNMFNVRIFIFAIINSEYLSIHTFEWVCAEIAEWHANNNNRNQDSKRRRAHVWVIIFIQYSIFGTRLKTCVWISAIKKNKSHFQLSTIFPKCRMNPYRKVVFTLFGLIVA